MSLELKSDLILKRLFENLEKPFMVTLNLETLDIFFLLKTANVLIYVDQLNFMTQMTSLLIFLLARSEGFHFYWLSTNFATHCYFPLYFTNPKFTLLTKDN